MPGEIVDQTTLIVIRQPILQIVQPGKIFAGALAIAIPVELDIMEQPRRVPLTGGLIKHPGEAKRDLEGTIAEVRAAAEGASI